MCTTYRYCIAEELTSWSNFCSSLSQTADELACCGESGTNSTRVLKYLMQSNPVRYAITAKRTLHPPIARQVWELRGMDHTISPQSRATYSQQSGMLLDACMVDNSHSVASASSDGTVHVRGRGQLSVGTFVAETQRPTRSEV